MESQLCILVDIMFGKKAEQAIGEGPFANGTMGVTG